jgi:hypothetical protein
MLSLRPRSIADLACYESCCESVRITCRASSNSSQIDTLEALSDRLRNRTTLAFTEDEYDGHVQPTHTREVKLSEDDVDLMWRVFDYAAVSKSQRASRVPYQPDE